MDKFDLKKYIAEGKILKENTSKYEPFEEGETFLRRSEIFDGKRDERMDIETKEQYDYLIKNGVEAFLDKYEDESDIDGLFFEPERFAEYEENSRYEYSLGEIGYLISISENNIQEDQSANQLKEDTSKSPEYKEGETILRRTQRIDRYEDYDYLIKSKEEYDYIMKNGVFAFEDNYNVESDEFEYEEVYGNIIETKYSIGYEGGSITPIQENKSTK